MKKLIVASVAACALAVMLAGCGSQAAPEESGSAEASAAATSAAVEAETSVVEETSVIEGMPNPWTDDVSAEEAAEIAQVENFSAAEGVAISYGEPESETYRAMDKIAEANITYPGVEVCIRKGWAVEGGDISGDYNEYTNTWTENVKGLEVTCFGNTEGEAAKTIWSAGKYCYAILTTGPDGSVDYGLTADDLNSLINAIQ